MSKLRHGCPETYEGWLWKAGEGEKRYRRYLRLKGSTLSNHHGEGELPTWESSLLEHPAGKGDREREIVVQLPKRAVSYYAESDEEWNKWAAILERACERDVRQYYEIGDLLGVGAFAKVYLGKDKDLGETVAIKEVDKRLYEETGFANLNREVALAQTLSDERFVSIYDIFDSKRWIHIVMEFMEGGELFDIIADKGHLSEQEASHVLRSLIMSVSKIHERGVAHCDIKPENILCESKEWPLKIKLCDFGLAKYTDPPEEGKSKMTGTPGYVAPEVVRQKAYGQAVDMWACGVVLYIMLSGKMPFYGRTDLECLQSTARGKFSLPDGEWKNISNEAKSLVKSLIQVDPEKRLTAKAALQHKWLLLPEDFSNDPINNDLSGLHSSRRKFKKAVRATLSLERLKVIAQMRRAT